MAAYVQDTNFFTRRTIVLFAIIGLHVFIAWALATGLARRAIELVAPPIQTEVVEEVQKKDEPPPPPPLWPPVPPPPTGGGEGGSATVSVDSSELFEGARSV